MVYDATRHVVDRVRPLLDQLASRTIDKARLLQYLSARAGVDWGVLDLVAVEDTVDPGPGADPQVLIVQDSSSGAQMRVPVPACLTAELDPLVRAEYKRLATAKPLTTMSDHLFQRLFGASHCARCRWQGEEHAQIHRECHYAGHPVNFEPRQPSVDALSASDVLPG